MSTKHVNINMSTNHVNKLLYMERNQNMGKSISARFKNTLTIINITSSQKKQRYRSGTVNSKSFISKVLLRIKRKFELIYAL